MSSKNEKSLRSPQSIEAGRSPTSPPPSHRAPLLKGLAVLGVIGLAAVSGIAVVGRSNNSQSVSRKSDTVSGVHAQSFEGLATCASVWGQCGGKNWNGATCCASGSFCSAQSEFYSQCLPTGSTPFPAFTTQPTSATPSPTTPSTPSPTNHGCIADWGQCGGVNYHGATCCSTASSTCSIQSDWYSQCLPAGTTPFPLVDYTFEQIENGVVSNPRTKFDGVEQGGVTTVAGYEGNGIRLNGVDGVVVVDNSESWDFSSSGFTLSAAVKRISATNEDGIITKWFTPDNFLLKFDGNSLFFTINFVTAGRKTITFNFPDQTYLNQWKFVKASYQRTGGSGSTMNLWWDGKVVGSLSVSDNRIVPSNVAVHVGNTNNAFSFFNGSMDNVRIWNAAV